ncbi:dienelactone hydrolase family protein [Aurantiacibacter luteus]|uniref:Dienelactone hydrolase domain-containing protein n=1 Tax=Aurantiacibacter luteus TaxID=1581420 RepID=A0A0G9MTM4_9SPHN|nr:dienelactone hydrolase family protein [Aurantiacibacter luteus]KLE34100.1 hypothetical protein AAW00_07370 [Aurantiacibacter luteus]
MCETDHLSTMPALSRRSFGALAGMGALAACTSMEGSGTAGGLTQSNVSFAADGGTMDGVFIHPASGRHPGVILWPDIAGLRPAKVEMGRRLAAEGYAVLVANPYYRSVAGQQFADFDAWRNGGMQATQPWRERNTPEAVMATARSVVGWLDAQAAVDTGKGIGNQGYCMTGSWTILSAAAVPGRIKAAASFHGGGLVGENPLAPVNQLSRMAADAGALIAIAQNDDASAPNDKVALRAAAEAAQADIEVEVYAGDHGWTVLDSPVYNQAEAERARAAMLDLYREKL